VTRLSTSYASQGFSADLRRRLRPRSRGRESAQTCKVRSSTALNIVREPPDVGCYGIARERTHQEFPVDAHNPPLQDARVTPKPRVQFSPLKDPL